MPNFTSTQSLRQPPKTLSYTFWLDGEPVHLDYENFVSRESAWNILGLILDHQDVQQQRNLDTLFRLGNEIAALKDDCLRHHRRTNLAQQAGVWEEE